MHDFIKIGASATARNDADASHNREHFKEYGLKVVNLIGSPGCGKTSLLEAMSAKLGPQLAVIEGDIRTTIDADRVKKAGARAVQIETGGECHLLARQVGHALHNLDLSGVRLLVIENVGNLVCPADYDLGEDLKIAVLSVAEGDEKPAKYPPLFIRASAVVITKIDLLPYVTFDLARAKSDCLKLNSAARFFETSVRTGQGLEELLAYLK
jgi:hydrogenase nickel incorporation protein HypB